jgi:hypothetical protein
MLFGQLHKATISSAREVELTRSEHQISLQFASTQFAETLHVGVCDGGRLRRRSLIRLRFRKRKTDKSRIPNRSPSLCDKMKFKDLESPSISK